MYELDLPQSIKDRDWFGITDDFDWYISPHRWTKLVADTTPTVSIVAGGNGGVLQLYTDATNNNECASYLTNEVFKFLASQPLICEAAMQFTEAATSAMNCFMGWTSLLSSTWVNAMVDDGAGMATNFSGATIFKVDGGTVWKFCTSNATTQTISTSVVTAGGSTYQRLRIVAKPVTATQVELAPFCNGVQLIDSNNKPIKHTLTLTSAAAMGFGVYAKAGSGSAETLLVDKVDAYQQRAAASR